MTQKRKQNISRSVNSTPDVHTVGTLDVSKYRCITEDITTDEVIITDERIEHIRERHPNDYERFVGYMPTINVISALLGTVTPFCSCSSIPLFIGFTSAGLPLGVTFSFLISSPMVDLGSLILLY